MDEKRESGTKQRQGGRHRGRHRSWSGVCLVITIEGVRALVTPRFDFRVSGESCC